MDRRPCRRGRVAFRRVCHHRGDARHPAPGPESEERTLADLERTFMVMAGADAAFDLLADPLRLPDYVPTVQLVDSIAIEGEADADADLEERDGAPDAGFVADRRTRTITWGRPEHDYAGSIVVARSTSSASDVTIRLHVRDDADADAVSRMVDQAVASIRRLVMKG